MIETRRVWERRPFLSVYIGVVLVAVLMNFVASWFLT